MAHGAWLAICAGLAGMMLIVKTSASNYSAAATLAAFSAVIYTFSQILTRNLGKSENSISMSFYGQIGHSSFAILTGMSLGSRHLYTDDTSVFAISVRPWIWPSLFDFNVFVFLDLVSGVGGLMLTKAYRNGPPSLVTSFEYLALPLAFIWEMVFWNELPNSWSILGITLILTAGVTNSIREPSKVFQETGI